MTTMQEVKVHEMRYTDQYGDTVVTWTRGNRIEEDAANAVFDSLRAKGYMAQSLSEDRRSGDVLQAFDPDAERLVMTRPLAGG